jgi:hypothetical protein
MVLMSVWMLQIKFNRKYSKAKFTNIFAIEQHVLDTNAGKQLS